jgi:hypothetical protein
VISFSSDPRGRWFRPEKEYLTAEDFLPVLIKTRGERVKYLVSFGGEPKMTSQECRGAS